MNVVTHGFHPVWEALRIGYDVGVRVAAYLPAGVNVDVNVSCILHSRFHHRIRHAIDHVFADVAPEFISRVPSHWRRKREIGRWRTLFLCREAGKGAETEATEEDSRESKTVSF